MGKKKTGRTIVETPTRIPDLTEAKTKKCVNEYLTQVQQQNTETARVQRFLILLKELFGAQPGFIEDYISGAETYVKSRQKDLIYRGRVDNLFGNLIIEFEKNLARSLRDAEAQLRRYVSVLWSNEPPEQRHPYLCIATDGIRFIVYSPVVAKPEKKFIEPTEIDLRKTDDITASELSPQDFYFWLDRYFLRQKKLAPTTENIVKEFGPHSHAFHFVSSQMISRWEELKSLPEYDVIFSSWQKYLSIVYGTQTGDARLFINHTYLATLAKLIAWIRLEETSTIPPNEMIYRIIDGEKFASSGIKNFLEEDFFSWVIRPQMKETTLYLCRRLLSLLLKYNFHEISEDVLKALYQEIVDPATRHDLGEFYTPDWLAERMVKKLLKQNPEASVIDPACGSGTFLYQAIRTKRDLLRDSLNTLDHISNSVVGLDIHPLAVIIAKTNYILALGELLKRRRQPFTIPVYLANSIRLPEHKHQRDMLESNFFAYEVKIDNHIIDIPEAVLKNPAEYDNLIEHLKVFAERHIGKEPTVQALLSYLKAQNVPFPENMFIQSALLRIVQVLSNFMSQNRDSIWAFILKNIYKPVFLQKKFDVVVGNPPWLAFRYAEPEYQSFLKRQILDEYRLLPRKKVELITHLELGVLFFLRSADLYLKQNGTIAFVLPRSIFTSDHHDSLRKNAFSKKVLLNIYEAWDVEKVSPLFNVPACVLFARKGKSFDPKSGIKGEIITGKLKCKNASLQTATEELKFIPTKFFLQIRGKRSFWTTESPSKRQEKASPYRKSFFQGATIVPRSFWFVKIKESPLGIDINRPPLETDPEIHRLAKPPYDKLTMRGTVESKFLYATLLSTDLVPFGYLKFRLVVLPIIPSGNHYLLLDEETAEEQGYYGLSDWLKLAQECWEKARGSKGKKENILQWLDYRHKLTKQNPRTKYRVIYNTSGTYLTASVILERGVKYRLADKTIKLQNFIADCVTYQCELSDKSEAFYLATILNSPCIDKFIKPSQAKGLFEPRHIHKKVLDLPIPYFNPEKKEHQRLVRPGEICTEKVAEWLKTQLPKDIRSIGKIRSLLRQYLEPELQQIDAIVQSLLK